MKCKNQYGDFDINQRLAEKGWSFSGDYENAHKKYIFTCPSGHTVLASWGALRLSFFCKACDDAMKKSRIAEADGRDRLDGFQCPERHVHHSM